MDAADIVPGDVLLVRLGDIVPADIKLLGAEEDGEEEHAPMQVRVLQSRRTRIGVGSRYACTALEWVQTESLQSPHAPMQDQIMYVCRIPGFHCHPLKAL
jgi:hypothetical protein